MTALLTLAAVAHPSGRRIDLRLSVQQPIPGGGDAERPPLRFVRRRLGFPSGPDDGVVVADLTDLFATLTTPWERLERFQFRTTNTGDADGVVDTDITLFYDAPAPAEAVRVRLRFFDPATQSVVEEIIDEGSHVDRTSGAFPPWQNRDTLEFFHTPGGGAETSAGVLRIFTGNADPTVADMLQWTPAAGPVRTNEFDSLARWFIERSNATILTFDVREPDEDAGTAWLTADQTRNVDAGTITWSLELRDRGLEQWVNYYYLAYDLTAASSIGQAVALATADYDSPRRLFLELPGAYQRADEPDPTTPTGAAGPLRRFLEPVGNSVDLARSIAQSVRDRHDVHTVRVDLLPHLARMIGWTPDLTTSAETQRRDILSAPEIFGSVGSIPNVRALVNRVTTWPCKVKEFANNVCLTNAPESIRLWEIWNLKNDGTAWTPPAQLTLTTEVDARPTLAVDGAGVVWMFFHSDRGGRREIWRQRLDGVDTAPVPARAGTSDDVPGFTAIDQDPAGVWDGSQIWVFWSSNRESAQWDIWARTFDNAANASDAIRLTDHPTADGSPAAVLLPGSPNRLWLFWSSRRRGPADIWSRVLNLSSGVWSDPERLTSSDLRDDRPAATVDGAGTLWLFWTRDDGSRETLWFRTYDGATWSAESALDAGHARDEAPTAVPWKGGVFVLWHSNHNGPWQIWGRAHDGTGWGNAMRLSPSVHGNKEPAAAIDSTGDMRVVWRSQRRARRYRSRTLDFDDAIMLAEMGTFEDRAHYTYDTALEPDDWYARGTVGLYLTPDTNDAATIAAVIDRTTSFLEPFRPAPVRYTWPTGDLPDEESVDVDDLLGESWSDDGGV